MKKIVGVIIIILFLIPFLSHSIRYFKESARQKKIVSKNKQSAGGASKVPTVPRLFKNPKKAGAPKEAMRSASKSSNVKSADDIVKKNAEEVKLKEQKGESNIHDEILTYRLNSKGHIKQIQAALRKAGFYKGEIDGRMGTRTRRAIKEFQKAKKLNPDGIVGEKTWEALTRYLRD